MLWKAGSALLPSTARIAVLLASTSGLAFGQTSTSAPISDLCVELNQTAMTQIANGKLKEAEQILLKGIALNPAASNLNYAMAYFYMAQQLPQKAKPYAIALYNADSNNPDYQELFGLLGIQR